MIEVVLDFETASDAELATRGKICTPPKLADIGMPLTTVGAWN